MKHVKKSMFISTVLMVVMLIAALSTATFAWYTSNNTAASTSTMVGAAQANDANIGIGFFAGAQDNQINFHSLVDSLNQGYLTPVVPATYYDPAEKVAPTTEVPDPAYGSTRNQALPDHYTTSIAVQSAGYIANGVDGNNYRRVVQMTDAQVADIVDQSAYVHSWSAEPKVLTNITTGAGGFNGNYELIYYIPYYVYNNEVAVDTVTPPIAVGDAITVAKNATNNPAVFTKVTSEPSGAKVYKIQRIYEIAADGATTAAVAKQPGVTKVTQDCANQLSRNANFIPQAGTYLVLYYDYQIAPYTTPTVTVDAGTASEKKMVTAIDANAEFVGYAGSAVDTLNDAQHDIQAEDVIWVASTNETYPKITEIKYDANGFAYLYKTFTGGAHDYTAISNKSGTNLTDNVNGVGGKDGTITWENFVFTKAAIDNVGFFKTNGNATTIGTYYTGNTNVMSDNRHYDLGVLSGISATASGNATETFYVTNNGSNNISNLSVALNVQGDNAALLRLAIFRNGIYYGTLASSDGAATTFGTILNGSKAADMATYGAKNQINLGGLNSGAINAAEFQLVAWFDGTLLNDVAAGKNCSFTLTFSATV